MANDNRPKLVIAISSTALFDMSDSHTIFESEGVEAYADYQRAHEDDVLGGPSYAVGRSTGVVVARQVRYCTRQRPGRRHGR